ncbi:MAG: endolytic transglycosylase MltG [Candidatus Magasanikiibacteriota bacterium]
MKFPIFNFQFYKFVGILTLLFLLLFGSYKCYRYFHPKYIPLPPRPEVTITIIPGWDLRDVAEYLVAQKLASSTDDVYTITGESAKKYKVSDDAVYFGPSDDLLEQKPFGLSMEGYLAPETIRVFADADLASIIDKFYFARKDQLTPNILEAVKVSKKSLHEILTMASILEREVRNLEDKKKVADIFWRRLKINWALQADSTVHYAVGKEGNVFTTAEDRQVDSLWNTYKYPGLPPSPICNPGLESIQAALYPEANSYWYFLTDKDGTVHYAKTLEEQNSNKYKYLN